MYPLKCSGRDDSNTWRSLKDVRCKREQFYCGLLTFSGLTPHVLRVLEGDRDFCGGIEIR